MANGDNSELLQAFNMFGQAAQQYGLSQAINQANARAKEIKASGQAEGDQRRQLMDLARESSVAVAGGGGSGIQVQALQGIAPPQPNTFQQAILQGQLQGDSDLVRVGQEGLQDEWNKELSKMKVASQYQANQQARAQSFAEAQQERAAINAEGRDAKKAALVASKPRDLPLSAATSLSARDSAATSLQGLVTRMENKDADLINSIGPVVGALPSWSLGADRAGSQAEIRRQVQQYRHDMSGAAFSRQEGLEYAAAVPVITDTPEQFIAKAKVNLKLYNAARARELDTFDALRYDTKGLRDIAPKGFTPETSAPAGQAENPHVQSALRAFTPDRK